jgi:hypothetical protein
MIVESGKRENPPLQHGFYPPFLNFYLFKPIKEDDHRNASVEAATSLMQEEKPSGFNPIRITARTKRLFHYRIPGKAGQLIHQSHLFEEA